MAHLLSHAFTQGKRTCVGQFPAAQSLQEGSYFLALEYCHICSSVNIVMLLKDVCIKTLLGV